MIIWSWILVPLDLGLSKYRMELMLVANDIELNNDQMELIFVPHDVELNNDRGGVGYLTM